MAALLHGRTVVAIAHRLHTAHDADRIAVVIDGRIAELGSHDELVAAGGRVREPLAGLDFLAVCSLRSVREGDARRTSNAKSVALWDRRQTAQPLNGRQTQRTARMILPSCSRTRGEHGRRLPPANG